jgi:Mg2+ and Co2+ transporter CorA
MANTIEDMINDLIHEQVDQVIDEKVQDNDKIQEIESLEDRIIQLEERFEEYSDVVREIIRTQRLGQVPNWNELMDRIKHI